eukprot:CAMPEP_0119006654 /NCGR_PEP_ID=MMETSP1176-20130426/2441_1 /TAXON_ID=265551 /ORGANISM="Synedropsis recta cf, Strain CCMP1620" /LENGTH=450 /DNA_ID=CAMNT_0006958605 /DNA_START=31 /DNA_END=1379 /DNA_ORIENTATION=+
MSFSKKSESTSTVPDFEAGDVVLDNIAELQNEKQPWFTRRRFQIITCVSLLIAAICLCVVVPVVVIQSKNNNSSGGDDKNYGTVWIDLGPKIVGELGNQELGESIALSSLGNIMAIGSNFHTANTGILNVYEYSGSQWTQRGQTLFGTQIEDYFGSSTQLSDTGNILLVGGRGDARGPNQFPGSVRAYQFNEVEDKWTPMGSEVKGQADGDQFGNSVSMSSNGQTWIAGGDNLKGAGGERNGYAAVYHLSGGNWVQRGSLIPGNDGEWTGYAVAMSGDGNTVCVGDRAYNVPDVGVRGRARCFAWSGGNWNRKGGDLLGKTDFAAMGYSLALSDDGNTVVAGARAGGDDSQGFVGVYAYNKGSWNQRGADMIGDSAGDQAGFQVAMSADGNVVAWSARKDNGASENTGVVRVLRWVGGNWVLLGSELGGDAESDHYGEAIALSSGGTIMA